MIPRKIFCLGILFVWLNIAYANYNPDEHITTIFESEKIDESSTLLDVLPVDRRNIYGNLHVRHLSSCFHSNEFNRNQQRHIFSYALRHTIRKYFVSSPYLKFYPGSIFLMLNCNLLDSLSTMGCRKDNH